MLQSHRYKTWGYLNWEATLPHGAITALSTLSPTRSHMSQIHLRFSPLLWNQSALEPMIPMLYQYLFCNIFNSVFCMFTMRTCSFTNVCFLYYFICVSFFIIRNTSYVLFSSFHYLFISNKYVLLYSNLYLFQK